MREQLTLEALPGPPLRPGEEKRTARVNKRAKAEAPASYGAVDQTGGDAPGVPFGGKEIGSAGPRVRTPEALPGCLASVIARKRSAE
jgi:hypothetical protein